MECENCNDTHSGEYGSGRFCSCKCARGFSTKEKRAEINERVSLKLLGSGNPQHSKQCPICLHTFSTNFSKRKQTFCSGSCRAHGMTEETRLKLSVAVSKARSKGDFKHSSISCTFTFDNKVTRCDSILERTGLTLLCSQYEVKSIRRCSAIIPYHFDRPRHFNPDFEITFVDGSAGILECKTFVSSRPTNKESRPLYFLTVPHKRDALSKFCQKNGLRAFWYDSRAIEEMCPRLESNQ